MSCKKFEKYERGQMTFAEFELHALECIICQEKMHLDERLMSMAKSLAEKPIHAPQLWSQIEESLRRENEKSQAKIVEPATRPGSLRPFRFRLLPLIPAAAALLVAAGLGIYFSFKALSHPPSSGLLAREALAKVEKKEREYVEAIEHLEQKALPKMASLDLEMMLLYREKLETIDAQIERCQEALAANPANAHIRRYLLAALQDKKAALADLLSYKPEKSI